MMRNCVWGVLLLGAAALFAAGFGTGEESGVLLSGQPREVVRLHVIANSDAPFDQMVKLKVRDSLIAYMAPKLRNAGSPADATAVIKENRSDIEALARRVLLLNGVTYPVQVQLGEFDFPVKMYGDVVYPAGRYNAVKVMLGEAQGSNWWCVLFPPLCFIDTNNAIASQTADLNQANDGKSRKVEFRWKITEILHKPNK